MDTADIDPHDSPEPCGKKCDHGSSCYLPANHLPASKHETEHGCIFYDLKKEPCDGAL